jgi:nucleoid-associated protein YgaU
MPKDDISHLPPDVQASIKAARDKKPKAGMRESVQDAMGKAMAKRKAEKKAKTYVVQPGDSLSKIAKELLGDAARWPEIFELNKDQIEDPNLIHVGQELRLP